MVFTRSKYFGAQVLLFEKDENGFFVSVSFAISCCSAVSSELLFVGYCTLLVVVVIINEVLLVG